MLLGLARPLERFNDLKHEYKVFKHAMRAASLPTPHLHQDSYLPPPPPISLSLHLQCIKSFFTPQAAQCTVAQANPSQEKKEEGGTPSGL